MATTATAIAIDRCCAFECSDEKGICLASARHTETRSFMYEVTPTCIPSIMT